MTPDNRDDTTVTDILNWIWDDLQDATANLEEDDFDKAAVLVSLNRALSTTGALVTGLKCGKRERENE